MSVDYLCRWMAAFPPESRERLRRINLAATSSNHVVLAVTYGLFDPSIRALNRMITNLLLLRMRLERRGDRRRAERVERKLSELHTAINLITGVKREPGAHHEACRRPPRRVGVTAGSSEAASF
ncbi:MAG: hypothetical protein AB7W16_15030 [Candidatus Obscuribacterales bacterium]